MSTRDWQEMVGAWRNVCVLGVIFVILGVICFLISASLLGFAVHTKDELRELLREVREIPEECPDPCADPCVDPCADPCPDPCPSPCPPPVDISEIIGVPSDTCDDKDPCTVDRLRNGSCIFERLENGCACTSDCFEPIGTGICWEGRCVGAPCKGFCDIANDCPMLNFTVPEDVNCVDGSCLYTIGPDINGSLPCTESCLFSESCKAMIFDNEPLKFCLKIDVFCAHNSDITCNYFFDCAVPLVF